LETSNKKGVDPLLVYAVIHQESGFKLKAESQAGAKGLMQVMPFHFKGLSVSQMFDPYNNVLHGIGLLSTALKKHKGNIRIALAEYNAGGEAVKKYGGIPPYSETRKYIANITSHYRRLKGV
jgi:soluble lytic murein transglycosylase-like protein